MSAHAIAFPVTYTRTLARELSLDTRGQQLLLKGTRLNPDDLVKLNGSIDMDAQCQIVRNALELSGDPALGLKWGTNLHLAAHGPLGAVIAAAPNLALAWRATREFHDILGGFASLDGEVLSDAFVVNVSVNMPASDVTRFFVEAVVSTLIKHLGMIIGRADPALRIEWSYPAPPYADVYRGLLHAPCVFKAARTRIVIPPGLATLPNPMADQDTYELALNRCEQIRLARMAPKKWSAQITDLLQRNPGQIWNCEEVAQSFHMSSRTLMRHLQDEGITYQAVRDAELLRKARHGLENPLNTVESVAHALGYQEASNFRRAFKRWVGLSPQQYIEKHRKGG